MKILAMEWRSGRDTVGFILVHSSDGRKRVYCGVAGDASRSKEADAQYIADFGARLSFQEARAFFPDLKEEEYGATGL